jgi:hypothetical protein
LWTAVFASFLASTGEGDTIYFATELLPPDFYYARRFNGLLKGQEESDRWQQSLVLMRIARECFAAAERSALTGVSAGVIER